MTAAPKHLERVVAQDRVRPSTATDALSKAKRLARELHDADRTVADLEERIEATKKRREQIRAKELPDVFAEAGIKELTVEADGNSPELVCQAKPFCQANIAADWDDDRREKGFAHLVSLGGGAIVKRSFVIDLEKGDEKGADKVRKLLDKSKIAFTEKVGCAWASLTAFVKKEIELRQRGDAQMKPLDLAALGAVVGNVVEVKPRKSKNTI